MKNLNLKSELIINEMKVNLGMKKKKFISVMEQYSLSMLREVDFENKDMSPLSIEVFQAQLTRRNYSKKQIENLGYKNCVVELF